MEVYALTSKGKATLVQMRQNPSLAKTPPCLVLDCINRVGSANAAQIADGTRLSVGNTIRMLGELRIGGLARIIAEV